MCPNNDQRVASPIATGEAGAFFEQHVGAFYLSLLTVRGIPPILTNTVLDEVHFQANRLGWHTDDILLVGSTSESARRQLALQVKRRFTVSAHNEQSKKAIIDFWNDFQHNEQFNREVDRLALVVLKGTDALLNDFNKLLDCARASADGDAFRKRLQTPDLLSKKSKKYESTIKEIITGEENAALSDDDLRAFLAILHVFSLDLNTSTAQAEVMVKSLLASCSNASDPKDAAATTWLELLSLVACEASGMPAAASYVYSQLPSKVRARHSVTIDTGPLQILREHSQITMDAITTTIGGTISIPRIALSIKLFDSVNTNQVAVIVSPAGAGKSALAKHLFQQLSKDAYCLAFRAEEFAVGHIDNALSNTTAAISAERLFAVLSGHGRIAIFVESVERLLEATVRDAFSDLLRLVRKYENLHLVLTCRDYSIVTIQSSLLEPNGLVHDVIEIPPLTNEELDQVAQENVNIATALKNDRLRELLRSPYLLNVAAEMDWSKTSGSSDVSEASFRQKCWSEVIRQDRVAANGLNRRREQVFLEVSVRRAKALRPYVQCGDLDPEALHALIADGLITTSRSSISFGAPSHDVLEDWATIQWIENEFLAGYGTAVVLADSVAGLPALRRGYRKWLDEKLLCDPKSIDRYVLESFSDASLPFYFRDDTLVCMLLSEVAKDFLKQHTAALLKDNASLLIRVIHLLRVACKSTPHWLNRSAHVPSVLLQPQGKAWATVIGIVKESIEDLLPDNSALILGLIEDWSGTVAWNDLTPPGFEDAGTIAHRLLPELGGYRRDSQRARALKVVVKIPDSQPELFRNLIQRACLKDREDDIGSELAEILLPGMNSSFCCRAYPDEMIHLTKSIFLLTDADVEKAKSDYNYSSDMDIDQYFGIRHYALNSNLHPASAMRGPFKWLLTYHPTKAAAFIIELMNHAGTWYGEQKWPYKRLEKPWQITLRVPDEKDIVQWGNGRLWGMYRGMSVCSQLLESALMALEDWLLAIVEMDKVDIQSWLLYLLKNSNNVAVTAVVASACIAHPNKAGKAGLAILSSKDLIQMDQSRMVGEHGRPDLSQMFPDFNAENGIYREERKKSDSLVHRRQDLEALAVQMQLTDQRQSVWQVIDSHRDALPSQETQTDEDRVWRLALHRMDVRGFEPMVENDQDADSNAEDKTSTNEGRRVYFGPGQLEDDVQALIDRDAPRREQHENTARLLNWGYGAWIRSPDGNYDSSRWPEMLAAAKDHENETDLDYIEGGPGLIAAVCVRDHWESMCDPDRQWCVNKLIEELRRDCDSHDHTVRVTRHAMRPDRAAAYVLPFIVTVGDFGGFDRQEIVEAIASGITHTSTEVQSYAAEGIGKFLHEEDSALMLIYAGALAMQARINTEVMLAERAKPYDERLPQDEIYWPIASEVRQAVLTGDVDAEIELSQIDVTEWPGQSAAGLVLQIFGHTPELSHAIEFHSMIAEHQVAEWNAKTTDRRHRTNFEFEQACKDQLARFALRAQPSTALQICGPIIDAAQDHPKGSSEFLQSLVCEEDKSSGETTFWALWQRFADQACSASWADKLDSDWQDGQKLVSQLFFGIPWKEGVKHWHRLEGNAHRIDALLRKLPPSSFTIRVYSRFLHDIGEQSLPDGYAIIAERLTPDIELDSNCIFDLELILSRQVFGEPLKLKSDHNVQQAVLRILDHLVQAGSSSAYRMRDDFVTPIGSQD